MLYDNPQTASTLSAAIYLLSMHPDALSRLRKEVMDTVGSIRRPTYDDIKQMKYLRAFINGEHLSPVSDSLFIDHVS